MKKTIIALGCAAILAAAAFAAHLLTQPKPPQTYAELIALSNDDLQHVDIARINLLCAQGLPGSENLDIDYCLQTLDQWAEHVTAMEKKYMSAFFTNAEKYDNSLAMFKMVYMGHALKIDLKCGYNMELVRSGAMADWRSLRMFSNSKDLFLHGFVDRYAPRTGTCGSLPFLMVAVGRRCGYPVHLVVNKGHGFCRWDDGQERCNIEISCSGVDEKPDEYYYKSPHPFTQEEAEIERFMANLTPAEELAISLSQRAACLRQNERYEEAYQVYGEYLKRIPTSEYVKTQMEIMKRKYGL